MTSLLDRLGRWNLRRLGARSSFLSIDDTRIHAYELPGGGEWPLVLLHGVGSSAPPFGPLIKRLRPHFSRLVMPEAPGHGLSEVPAGEVDAGRLSALLEDTLAALVDEPFSLYGNSLGGGQALRYAIDHPERVTRLFVLSPAGARTSPEALRALVESFDLRSAAEARAFMRRLLSRPRWWARLAARDLRRNLARPLVRSLLTSASPGDELEAAAVEALPMPILFIWGGAERILPAEHLRWFRAHLPSSATLLEPAHFGHSAYIEFPDEVAEMIVSFIREAGRPSSASEGEAPAVEGAR